MRQLLVPLALVACAVAGVALEPQDDAALPTAGADASAGVLSFRVADEAGEAIPCRLTFFPAGTEEERDLFPGVGAAPDQLAVRRNVVYSLAGQGRITVPAGAYTVYATRGIEWSRAETTVTIEPGRQSTWTATLRHEVDTTGWVGGDFHLHTLTHSGHGDSNLPERIVSLVGEGVELAVATDHDHNTDYAPTVTALGAGAHLTTVVGNEVSTRIGHFNAFPLDPARPVLDSSLTDANELFRLIRAEPNAFDVTPVVQLNHPRWDGIDYFARTGLDPVTGTSDDPAFSLDFDSLEVLNENVGWGYFEPWVDGVETDANLHSVLQDWYHLLDRGHRAAAVGNSDSHTVHYAFAGYPRNLVYTGTDDPGTIDPAAVAEAVRAGAVVATTGPVLDVRVGDARMGGTATAVDGRVRLQVDVRCASWIACDRLEVVVNGDTVRTVTLPERTGALDASYELELQLEADAWIVVLAEGDTPLAPIVPTRKGRPAWPLAIANPLRVDADGDGAWTPPYQQAEAAVAALAEAHRPPRMLSLYEALSAQPAAEAARWILAGAEHQPPLVGLAACGLGSPDRRVRLAAARALERSAERIGAGTDEREQRALATMVADAYWWLEEGDPYLEVALLRVLLASPDFRATTSLADVHARLLRRHGEDAVARLLPELTEHFEGTPVVAWRALGYFDAPQQGTIRDVQLGPETAYDPTGVLAGRAGEVRWRDLDAAADGHVDLRRLAREGEVAEDCFAYAETWLHAPADLDALVGLGTDDGGRVYVNGTLVHEDLDRQGASPLQHVRTLPLRAGWNRVVFQVENGGGAYGLYLQLLDDRVHSARSPDA